MEQVTSPWHPSLTSTEERAYSTNQRRLLWETLRGWEWEAASRERCTPSSLWPPDLREAWESFWGGGRAWPGTWSAGCERTGPPPEREHAGRGWGNAAPEVKCLGCLPAAAANVRTLEGRAHSAGENGRQRSGAKGNRGQASLPIVQAQLAGPLRGPRPPLPGGRQNLWSVLSSFFCFSSSLSGVGAVTLSAAFRF